MFELVDILLNSSRGMAILVGGVVIGLLIFATGAKRPRLRCPRCQEINRPVARYCAHCGQQLDRS